MIVTKYPDLLKVKEAWRRGHMTFSSTYLTYGTIDDEPDQDKLEPINLAIELS